jgi:hypothetical protein
MWMKESRVTVIPDQSTFAISARSPRNRLRIGLNHLAKKSLLKISNSRWTLLATIPISSAKLRLKSALSKEI